MAWVGYIAVVIIGIGAVVGALSVIWKKAIQPTANFITLVGELKPLLEELTEVFKDNPNGFKILDEIQSQFRTNDGSSLRDQIDGLTAAARLNAAAAEKAAAIADSLRVEAAAQVKLGIRDREVMQELTLKLDRVIEAAKIVAHDLKDSHARADAVTGDPGAAADAAVQRDRLE